MGVPVKTDIRSVLIYTLTAINVILDTPVSRNYTFPKVIKDETERNKGRLCEGKSKHSITFRNGMDTK